MDEENIEKIVQGYLNHCRYEKGLDAKTLKAYKTDIAQLINYANRTGGGYSKECLQTYIASLHANYAVKSVKRKIASLKAFFGYLEYEEILRTNPFSKMRVKLHEPFLLPRTIPLADINSLLGCAYSQLTETEESTYKHRACLRDIAVLELLFATGVRISELCSLHATDINVEEGYVRIYGKGAKQRLIQIGNEDVLAAVKKYGAAFSNQISETGWFFINRLGNKLSDQSVRNMVNKYCKIVGIQMHITPHMFRHSFATLLLEEDVDIRYIQQLLGHSSIVTTQIYTHVTSKKQRDILTTRHPRNKLNIL